MKIYPMAFTTIYADPPWKEAGGGKIKRGAGRHYSLMKTADIASLLVNGIAVRNLAPDNAHLYLWVTNNFLEDGLEVMRSWGFRYVTKITWKKIGNPGLGQYFRGLTEDCLFGVRGMVPYKIKPDGKRSQSTTYFETDYFFDRAEFDPIESVRGVHSEKPEEMRRRIEMVSTGPFIELFSRKAPASEAWTVWGDQCLTTEDNRNG
jgi:N6-adenosine-specific RNA methylase IME4